MRLLVVLIRGFLDSAQGGDDDDDDDDDDDVQMLQRRLRMIDQRGASESSRTVTGGRH